MKIRGIQMSIKSILCLLLYYAFAQYLPSTTNLLVGKLSKRIRYSLCKRIFKSIGHNVNIERRANFGSGRNIEIGDNSGIGLRCVIPSNTIIGKDVLMGPNCYIISQNHNFSRTDIPMRRQGSQHPSSIQTIIEDDVWIGMNVLMTPGRHIQKGTIVGAGTLLCKDFPPYSIVGGNPSKLIRSRLTDR